MIKECKNCKHFGCFNKICKKDHVNHFGKCDKYSMIPVEELKKERNKLLISKENPERLEELEERIKYFNAGVL